MAEEVGNQIAVELRALSEGPSRKACSFKSMTSFGSHYRVDLEESRMQHVTYDSGVAELRAVVAGANVSQCGGAVELVRVGVLKDILVVAYGNFNVVLMVVSWVAKDMEFQPRMQRDAHGFWLANMAAVPRDIAEPYLLPALASQVYNHGHVHSCPHILHVAQSSIIPCAEH